MLPEGEASRCLRASVVTAHFLVTWWRLSTFSVASPPMHAWLRCRWCDLPLACSTACAAACATAHARLSRVAPRALARPSGETWRVGDANVYDGVQPRTLLFRLRFLETSTAHDSSHVTPQRVQPSRAVGPHASLVSSSLSRLQNRGGAASPCAPSDQQRGRTFRIQRTFSSRMCACVDSDSSCKHDARVLQLHGLLASCRSKGTACP